LLVAPGSPEEAAGAEEGHREQVEVTATRTERPVGEAFSLVTRLDAEELHAAPHLALDDVLRRVPGFSLFRRSSSLASHPTTQGVSLRGIGPSGAGRSLVLLDGIPLNDPFGGWVHWNRLPSLALEAVEVTRGATSQLYGSAALGGALQLLPRRPTPGTVDFRARYGSHDTRDMDLFASDTAGGGGWLVAGRSLDTDGFFIVDEKDRGEVDAPLHAELRSVVSRYVHPRVHAGVHAYREERGNGTDLQENRSRLGMVELGARGERWTADVHAQWSRLESTFSRVLPDRSAERVTARQEFSSRGAGASFLWRSERGWLAGADLRGVEWSGERQSFAGAFVQDIRTVSDSLDVLLGLRLDAWRSHGTRRSASPRLALLYRPGERTRLRASAYRGFRAPTLNELFRPFRVGNVVTEANADLDEEELVGIEGGGEVDLSPRVTLRANAYWNSLRDPVGNVTLASSPTLVQRERQNIGRATVKGLELDVEVRRDRWRLWMAWLGADATVDETGLRLPQVPRQQASAGVERRGVWTAGLWIRYTGEQYEDDLNRLELSEYAVVDLMLRRPLSRRIELFVGAENLLDRDYPVGRVPIERLGTPRVVHGGLRLRFSGDRRMEDASPGGGRRRQAPMRSDASL
jgi:outer membrane receptor protein involved in Fe transport